MADVSDSPTFTVAPFTTIEQAESHWWPLVQELGWNRSRHDVPGHFHATLDGKTWLYIIPSPNNKPAGSVMACVYPNSTGWVGCFIMEAAHRGKGLGRELWKEMELTFRQHKTAVIGLDAVPEQVGTYGRRGFISVGKIPLMTRASLEKEPFDQALALDGAVELQDIRDVDAKELARVDMEHTGLDRTAYWVKADLANARESGGFAIVEEGKVTGFVWVRRVQSGHRFGPLYAETFAQAKQLLHKAMNDVRRTEAYHVEIFGANAQGVKVFEELGWEYVGLSYDRMWLHGKMPQEQEESGKGAKGMFATFDAASG